MLRLVAALVVFLVVFVLLTLGQILLTILGGAFLPILLISLAVAAVFLLLDVLSGWNQPPQPE